MTIIYPACDERYPDWSLYITDCGGGYDPITLTAEELADYNHVRDEYIRWQRKIRDLVYGAHP